MSHEKSQRLIQISVARGNSSRCKHPSMNSSEIEHLRSLNEPNGEHSALHITSPFASEVEALSSFRARAENANDDMIASMFLEGMYSQMVQASQPNYSQASSDRPNLVDATATNPVSSWSLPNASEIDLEDWPNLNREQATDSKINEQKT